MEAEYPPLLCSRMAQCVLQAVATKMVVPTMMPRLKELLTLSLGQQTLRHPALIPEYADIVTSDHVINDEAYKLLLAAPFSTGDDITEQQDDQQQETKGQECEQFKKKPRPTFRYGVWHTPEQFLSKAENVKHPMDDESYLHEATKQAVCKDGTFDSGKKTFVTVFNLRKLTTELCAEETKLKQSLHPDVAKCIESKNIRLFEHVLGQLGYWDMAVVDLMKNGVPLVGLQPTPKGYKEQLVPATITEDELTQAAPWRRKCLMAQTKTFKPE